MKDTRLLYMKQSVEAALEIGSELAGEGNDNASEAARLDMIGRRLTEARAALIALYEPEYPA